MDVNAIIESAALAAAKELDGKLPDGFIQSGGGQVLATVGKIITRTGELLGGAENSDGDR
jgi:hypothetical protein